MRSGAVPWLGPRLPYRPTILLVPVIRSAQALGLKAFSDEAKRLAGGAIDGTLPPR